MRKLKTCETCGKIFEKPKRSGTKYCKTECRHVGEADKFRRREIWSLVNR